MRCLFCFPRWTCQLGFWCWQSRQYCLVNICNSQFFVKSFHVCPPVKSLLWKRKWCSGKKKGLLIFNFWVKGRAFVAKHHQWNFVSSYFYRRMILLHLNLAGCLSGVVLSGLIKELKYFKLKGHLYPISSGNKKQYKCSCLCCLPYFHETDYTVKSCKAKFSIIPIFQFGFLILVRYFCWSCYSCAETPKDGNRKPTVEFDRRPGLVSVWLRLWHLRCSSILEKWWNVVVFFDCRFY